MKFIRVLIFFHNFLHESVKETPEERESIGDAVVSEEGMILIENEGEIFLYIDKGKHMRKYI